MAREHSAAQTAFGPMVLAAVEQNEAPQHRLVQDDLAFAFLPAGLRAIVAATRLGPLRRMMLAASERSGPGLWANLACRKRFIDDRLDDRRRPLPPSLRLLRRPRSYPRRSILSAKTSH